MRRAVALLACAACLIGCDRAAELRLGVSTEEPAPQIATLIAEALGAARLPTTLVHYETPAAIASALARGELDLALVEEPLAPSPGIGVLRPIYPSVLHVLAARGAAAVPLPELLGMKVYGGPSGSAGQRLAVELGRDFGVAEPHLLANPWDDEPEAYFTFGGLLPADALRQLDGFALRSLDETFDGHAAHGTRSLADTIALRHPNLRPFVLPPALYPSLRTAETTTLAVDTLLVARLALADDLAFRVVEQVTESAQRIANVYPLARATLRNDPDAFVRTLPLHRGARRYLERDRPSFVERYTDVLAFATTLTIALSSAAVGWLRRRRRARKDRVDRYLTRVLDLRNDVPRADRLTQLHAIEREVLELVVAEKIEADVALIAFLDLCASVRHAAHAPLASASRD